MEDRVHSSDGDGSGDLSSSEIERLAQRMGQRRFQEMQVHMQSIASSFKQRLLQHRRRAIRPLTPTSQELARLDKDVGIMRGTCLFVCLYSLIIPLFTLCKKKKVEERMAAKQLVVEDFREKSDQGEEEGVGRDWKRRFVDRYILLKYGKTPSL